jgi:hypothetical protein
MSQWEYEAGRRAVLQNVAEGDFSNLSVHDADTPEKRLALQNSARLELELSPRKERGSKPCPDCGVTESTHVCLTSFGQMAGGYGTPR